MRLPFDEVSAHKQLDDIDTPATEAREAMARQDAGRRNEAPGEDQPEPPRDAEAAQRELKQEAPDRLRKVQDEVAMESRRDGGSEPR